MASRIFISKVSKDQSERISDYISENLSYNTVDYGTYRVQIPFISIRRVDEYSSKGNNEVNGSQGYRPIVIHGEDWFYLNQDGSLETFERVSKKVKNWNEIKTKDLIYSDIELVVQEISSKEEESVFDELERLLDELGVDIKNTKKS